MAGIERIKIISGWNDSNIKKSMAGEPFTNSVYFTEFERVGMPLLNNEVVNTEVSKDGLKARYDFQEGIDIILTFKDHTRATLQEKILDTKYDTATFEEYKKNGELGDWYRCTAQLYFVGYLSENWQSLRCGMMFNLAEVRRLSMNNKIKWTIRDTKYLNRNTGFRFFYFNDIPESAVIFRF